LEKPIINKELLLEKFHGKGGWTYTCIPGIERDKRNKFGWVKVKGFIDSFELKKYHLAPMKDGKLFLPVSAMVRKAIGKEEGDHVQVTLFLDNDPVEIPVEIMDCLREEPEALKFFYDLSDTDQQNYINWIYEAKKEETRIGRIALSIEKLLHKKRFYDKFSTK
jgi:hypothetical protein